MFSDYDTPTPASVYLIINPEQKVEYLRLFDCGWLFSFIEQEVSAYRLCKDRDIPDNWLMEYRFKDQSLIPPFSNTDNGDYLSRLLPVTNSLGIWPSNVVRLRDAVFCHKMHIEPLSDQGSHDVLLNHPHFTSSSNYYDDKLVKEENYRFPCWKALESERGVLLFSETENGKLAFRKYWQYLTDHFFDPKFHIEFLNEYHVPKFMDPYAGYVDRFYDLRIKRSIERESITPIPQEFFAPRELVRTGFCQQRFDMTPTGKNYELFADGMHIYKEIKVTLDNYRLASLLHLCECGEPIHQLSPEKHQMCPYEADLNAIREKYYNKPSEEQEKAYREYGEKHLKEEFPLYWQKIAEHRTPEQGKTTTPKIRI